MINLKEVRKNGNRPRVHGNGFIQIDLTDRSRLHIWGDPRIPKQKVATPIHDHVFSFESICIVGRLINVNYATAIREWGTHTIYLPEIREGEDTILKSSGIKVSPFGIGADLIMAGETSNRIYNIEAGYFHETVATEPSATVITKDGPTQAQGAEVKPRVLVPVMMEPDNEFNRYDANEDLLWRITEDVLARRK